jgi:organic radical activating enzyme
MYKIVEVFRSVQSEGTHAGTPATFIRFFGCNLACKFGAYECDEPLHTEKDNMTEVSLDDLLETASKGPKHVVITGGEPSMYDLNQLLGALRKAGHYVQVETNGLNIDNIRSANFITYSPKFQWSDNAPVLQSGFHELKLLASE